MHQNGSRLPQSRMGLIPECEAVRSAILAEIFQHITNGAIRLKRMPQCFIQSDLVAVSAANFCDLQETGFDQLGHDLLHHSLRDSHQHRDFSQSDLGVSIEAQQHMRMVRQKRPASSSGWRCVY